MNGEFKIFLYIVVGIGYFILKLYRKELKKQNDRHISKRPTSSRTAEDIFKELQKSLNLPDISERQAPVLSQQSRTVKERKSDDMIARQKKIFASEGSSKMKHYKAIKASKLKRSETLDDAIQEKTAKIENEYGPDIEFDPRKAIIFSEIIKRPQY